MILIYKELKTPSVSPHLPEYLRKVFSFSTVMARPDFKSNDELVGFQKGIEEVINHLIGLLDGEE